MEPRALARLLGALLLAVTALPAAALSFNDPGPADQLAQRITQAMTDDELLGQVLFMGWQGVGPSKEILRWIAERGIGGIKIFPRNVADLPSLAGDIAGMQRLARRNRFAIPLFVATDQEGGWVRQIKDETSVSPGNLALGASNMPIDAYRTGALPGRELAALGINMDFAPTADTYSNPEASVIGPRSFGSDPATTGLLSAAYARGMQSAGVVTTAKHYPGHGSADSDSHGHLPKIDVTLDQLLNRDLVPYRILIREGIPAIMTGHLAFPRILGNLTPSSLSPMLLEDVLRKQLGFQGLLITDDMEMEGVLSGGLDTPQACRAALAAGNNMVLISHTPARPGEDLDVPARGYADGRPASGGHRGLRAPRPGHQAHVLPRRPRAAHPGSAAVEDPGARGWRPHVLLPERLPRGHAPGRGAGPPSSHRPKPGAAGGPVRRVPCRRPSALPERRIRSSTLSRRSTPPGQRTSPRYAPRLKGTTPSSSASPTSTVSRC